MVGEETGETGGCVGTNIGRSPFPNLVRRQTHHLARNNVFEAEDDDEYERCELGGSEGVVHVSAHVYRVAVHPRQKSDGGAGEQLGGEIRALTSDTEKGIYDVLTEDPGHDRLLHRVDHQNRNPQTEEGDQRTEAFQH